MRAQVAAPLKFLMKKVGKRPAAQQAGEPVVNRAAVVHQATPKGSQGGRLSALSWGSVMPAKPLARRRRRHIAKRCLVGH